MIRPEIIRNKTFSRDGTAIAFTQSGSGPALLLIHGSGSDHTRWTAVTPYLTPYFTVYCMDRRGRGESGDAAVYTIQREYEDICAVAEAIGQPLDIVAHSFGAVCALGAARQIPNLMHLILYEPPLLSDQQSKLRLRQIERMENALAEGDRETVLLILLNAMLHIPLATLERLRGTAMWERQLAAAHTVPRELRNSAAYDSHLTDLNHIGTETLLLVGSESLPAFHETVKTLKANLPVSELSILQGQQHSAMVTAPEIFAEAVTHFLIFCELGC